MASMAMTDSASLGRARPAVFYRPELDALRFFACFAVFLHHIGPSRSYVMESRFLHPFQQAGAFGVCLFFLLSAYLITELLWKERARTGSIHLRSFYVRRILRIWPLYFACLIFYLCLSLFFPLFAVTPGRILAIVFLVGNWYFAIFGWGNIALNGLWTISIEEQFYLLVPTIAKFGGKRAIWWASAFFLIASQLTVLLLGKRHMAVNPAIWTNSIVQFQFFAAGCILALVVKDRKAFWGAPSRLTFFLVGMFVWGVAGGPLHLINETAHPSAFALTTGYMLVLVGTILFFLAAYGMPSRWIPRWVIYLGKISFGLYLVQGFVIEVAYRTPAANVLRELRHHIPLSDIVVEAGLTVLLASLSYQFLEKPFLRLKNRFSIIHSRPV